MIYHIECCEPVLDKKKKKVSEIQTQGGIA